MTHCDCGIEVKNRAERRTLITLLVINATLFVAEIISGIIADSTALIADSLDMLADASVYAISLYAVGKHLSLKAKAALTSGILQVMLGLGVLADILRRTLTGSEPEPQWMIIVGIMALIANIGCVALIHKHRHGDVHMRASWVFSANDVIANLGVIGGGILVVQLGSSWPDLVIGLAIAAIVIKGGIHIIYDAKTSLATSSQPPT